VCHHQQVTRLRHVLESRERRLGCETQSGNRIATEQQFLDRIVRKSIGIVAVGVATGDQVDSLAQEIDDRMRDPSSLARVDEMTHHRLGQSKRFVGGAKQDRPSIRARMRLIKGGDDGFEKGIREKYGLRGILQGEKGSCVAVS